MHDQKMIVLNAIDDVEKKKEDCQLMINMHHGVITTVIKKTVVMKKLKE